MYHDNPKTCLVYKDGEKIIGVTFNKVEDNKLYMRQIFVKEGFRDKGIGRIIYNTILKVGEEMGLRNVKVNIREEAKSFHKVYNPKRSPNDIEYYMVR